MMGKVSGRGKEGSMDLALTVFLRANGTCWHCMSSLAGMLAARLLSPAESQRPEGEEV